MRLEAKQFDQAFELKHVGDAGEFEGYGSVFNVVDSLDDVVLPGAFRESLANHAADGTFPAMLLNHNPDQEIGEWQEIREDDRGLFVSGRLWIDGDRPIPAALQAHRSMRKERSKMGLSIGFVTKDAERDPEDRGRRLLKAVELWEISPVVFPANPAARVEAVKAAPYVPLDPRSCEKQLRDVAGFSKSDAKALLHGGWAALSSRCDAEDDVAAMKQVLASLAVASARLSYQPKKEATYGVARRQERRGRAPTFVSRISAPLR